MIDVQHITKRYGDKLALDDVSFGVRLGEVLGLLGLNGAGKSTAMNIITGFIGATRGTVTVGGHDVVQEPIEAKRLIGYLPERLAFYGDMRVREYLDFVCDLKGVKQGRAEHVAGICEQVGIAHMTSRLVRNMSKGYQQRLGFAQALVGDPQVLILDEPTAGLDPSQIVEIRALIQHLGETRAVMISSHILSEIQAVCNRIVVLHEGRVMADDTPENLTTALRASHQLVARILGLPEDVEAALSRVDQITTLKMLGQREANAYEYLIEGPEGSDIRVEVFRALAEADLPLLDARGKETSLERVFLRLVDQPVAEVA